MIAGVRTYTLARASAAFGTVRHPTLPRTPLSVRRPAVAHRYSAPALQLRRRLPLPSDVGTRGRLRHCPDIFSKFTSATCDAFATVRQRRAGQANTSKRVCQRGAAADRDEPLSQEPYVQCIARFANSVESFSWPAYGARRTKVPCNYTKNRLDSSPNHRRELRVPPSAGVVVIWPEQDLAPWPVASARNTASPAMFSQARHPRPTPTPKAGDPLRLAHSCYIFGGSRRT